MDPTTIRIVSLVHAAALLLAAVSLPAAAESAPTAESATADVSGSLDLRKAIDLALARHPRLKAATAAVRASEGRALQAGLHPNPEVEIEIEDVGVTGDEKGFDASVYTVRASQPIELGHKRPRRQHVADLEASLSRWDVASLRHDVATEVALRFIELLAAQERVTMVADVLSLSSRIRDTVAERVQAGKVSPLELTKANVELSARRVALKRAERKVSAARLRLAAMWQSPPELTHTLRAEGDLAQLPEDTTAKAFAEARRRNPDLARWETARQLAQATVEHERAAAIPDVTVSAAVAHERESGNEVIEVALGLPLPLFDRNQGNVAAARAEADQTRESAVASQIALRTEFDSLLQELRATLEEAQAIRDDLRPGAQTALSAAEEAYRSGKLDYLEVLDAQQTLFETDMHWIEALSAAHKTSAQIDRLLGRTYLGVRAAR